MSPWPMLPWGLGHGLQTTATTTTKRRVYKIIRDVFSTADIFLECHFFGPTTSSDWNATPPLLLASAGLMTVFFRRLQKFFGLSPGCHHGNAWHLCPPIARFSAPDSPHRRGLLSLTVATDLRPLTFSAFGVVYTLDCAMCHVPCFVGGKKYVCLGLLRFFYSPGFGQLLNFA